MSLFVPTPGFYYPPVPGFGATVGFTNSSIVDAAGEKFCSFGRMWNRDGTAKSIRKVGFRLGTTLVKASNSTVRISLQDMATTGPPGTPDETQDQLVDIGTLGDANWVASGWYQTAAFSADRSVALGELVAVVFEFQSFAGSDSFTLSGLTRSGIGSADLGSNNSHKSGTWTANNAIGPTCLLEFSDATFGTLGLVSHLLPVVSNAASSANLIHLGSTTTDERANRFVVPCDCYCDGAWFQYLPAAATSDWEAILYEGTTARKTVTVDGGQLASVSGGGLFVNWTPQLMTEGTTWYISMRPLINAVGSAISPQSITVANANHWQTQPGGTSMFQATRVDQGAWVETATTSRILAGISISSIDVESGAAAGGGAMMTRIQGGF